MPTIDLSSALAPLSSVRAQSTKSAGRIASEGRVAARQLRERPSFVTLAKAEKAKGAIEARLERGGLSESERGDLSNALRELNHEIRDALGSGLGIGGHLGSRRRRRGGRSGSLSDLITRVREHMKDRTEGSSGSRGRPMSVREFLGAGGIERRVDESGGDDRRELSGVAVRVRPRSEGTERSGESERDRVLDGLGPSIGEAIRAALSEPEESETDEVDETDATDAAESEELRERIREIGEDLADATRGLF